MNIKYVITKINCQLTLCRLEDDICVELTPVLDGQILDNIYIARVENVVKNINSAFVEISKGVKCYYSMDSNKRHLFLNRKNNTNVNQGDLLLVQVNANPVKTKPASACDKITLTGKYVVLSTDVEGVNISKKNKGSEVCKEIRSTLLEQFNFNVFKDNKSIAPEQVYIGKYGFIVRTNAADANIEAVLSEANALVNTWEAIANQAVFGKAFTCLYESGNSYINNILNAKTSDLYEIITDESQVYDNLLKHLPDDIKDKLRFYSDELLPLNKLYSLNKELERALNKRVWLPCGGYLVIEQTEALTVIDVNSGKFIADKKDKDLKNNTILKVNKEAAFEIAKQLRIRNISGIIIVDFINMESESVDNELIRLLKNCVKNDPQKCNIIDITKLGLVEMTRQRKDKSLQEYNLLYSKNGD